MADTTQNKKNTPSTRTQKVEVVPESQDMSKDDLAVLEQARYDMEHINVWMRGLNKVGSTVESGLNVLSEDQRDWLNGHINRILLKILRSNLNTMEKQQEFKEPSPTSYKLLVSATGAGSGFFGAANPIGAGIFVAELLASTKFMTRSIMDIARGEGEDLYDVETQLACLQVFALGGDALGDDDIDTGYYATRIAMGTALKGAGAYISKNGLSGISKLMMGSVNPVIKVLGLITSRFTVQVSEKFLTQAVPLIGAAGGGFINYVFISHFQKMAKAHFTIRRLERKYGEDIVKSYYNELREEARRLNA